MNGCSYPLACAVCNAARVTGLPLPHIHERRASLALPLRDRERRVDLACRMHAEKDDVNTAARTLPGAPHGGPVALAPQSTGWRRRQLFSTWPNFWSTGAARAENQYRDRAPGAQKSLPFLAA